MGGFLQGLTTFGAPVAEATGGFLNLNQQANLMQQNRQAAAGLIGNLGPEYEPLNQAVQAGMDPIFALNLMGGPSGAALQTNYQRQLISQLQAANPKASPEDIMNMAMPMLMMGGGDPSKLIDWMKGERELAVPSEEQATLQHAYQTGQYPEYMTPQMQAATAPDAPDTLIADTTKLRNEWLAGLGKSDIKRVETGTPSRTGITETDVPYPTEPGPVSGTPGWTAPPGAPGVGAAPGVPGAPPGAPPPTPPPVSPTVPPPGAPPELGVPRMKAPAEAEMKLNQQGQDMINSSRLLQNHMLGLGPSVQDAAKIWDRGDLMHRIFDKYAAVNYGILPTDDPDTATAKILKNSEDAKAKMLRDPAYAALSGSDTGLKLAGVMAEMITYNALANSSLLASMGTRNWQAAASHEGHIPVLTGNFWSIQTQIYNLTNQYKNQMTSRGAIPSGPFAMSPIQLRRLKIQTYMGPDGRPHTGYWVDPNAMD